MSKSNNAELELLRKADLTIQNLLDDGGLLPPEIATAFYRKIMDTTTIFNNVRQVPMTRNEMRIPTIVSNGRMLRVARNMYSGSSLGNNDQTTGMDLGYGSPNRALDKTERAGFTTGIITMKTDELIAVVQLTYEMLEDIIEGGSIDNTEFQNLVLDLMAQQIALDLEEKLVLGDTTNNSDAFLALQDGIIKLATSNIVNQNSAPISHLLFANMIKTLPVRFQRLLNSYAFFANSNVVIDYRAQLAQRQGVLGDAMVQGINPLTPFGVPMLRCGFLPTDTMILTDPRNILFGIQRRFRLATERWEENRIIKIIVTMRVGQAVEQEEMMVKALNIGTLL